MTDLSEKKCIPCEGGIPGFDITEIHKYLKMVDGWEVKEDGSKFFYLIKEFKFKNFLESQNFINKVGEIAEQEGHHPNIEMSWGRVVLIIYTHNINDLTEKLLILINDKMMRKKMGEEGRHYVEANYRLEECGLLMESVYNKCM